MAVPVVIAAGGARAPDGRRMTEFANAAPRQVACPRCGVVFTCSPGGACWCAAEDVRLPVPQPGAAECLCRDCLREAAAVANSPRS